MGAENNVNLCILKSVIVFKVENILTSPILRLRYRLENSQKFYDSRALAGNTTGSLY
jgi:hypothetical protein